MNCFAIHLKQPLPDKMKHSFLEIVDDDLRKKLARNKRKSDFELRLCTHVLLRMMINRFYQYDVNKLTFGKNLYGKLYIEQADIHFNISHSHEWGICVIDRTPVGVDIEKVKPINVQSMMKCFSESEQKTLLQLQKTDQIQEFYRIWVLKESYLKKLGVGLSKALNSFAFHTENNRVIVQDNQDVDGTHYFYEENLDKHYKVAICAEHKDFPEHVSVLSIQELSEYIAD
ncbi:4'-phosphopantetheinyl transferase family protein [Halalkalibacter urbisdiaboli]|uniref:4'-phosphopantetheinyl transferase family protein n=1 Tax=Halalkalibacter urbisdiaboli TaxID=1960589 RepID=UPI0013FD3B5C|nr:4'-phosphopantetheinyl transferase superfamily protein [Halalkalibacter urbisdiaboli]